METDRYGRRVPKQAHGSINLSGYTSSTKEIMQAVGELFDRIVKPDLQIRRMYVVANRVMREEDVQTRPKRNSSIFSPIIKPKKPRGRRRKRRAAESGACRKR